MYIQTITARLWATLRCVILASDDGAHPTVGGVYDAESEGVRFETQAKDEYSILVATLDGEKKPYYESYESLKEGSGLRMNVKGLVNTGMTSVIVTHEMRFAQEVSDRVLFIADGNILEQGPPQILFNTPVHPRLQGFLKKVL